MHPMLNTAVKAARKAGSIISRASSDLYKLTVPRKRQNDFVSEVDHAAEAAIISVLRDAYPARGLAWRAAGRIDGFWEIGLAPWDMAAGALLVREAGGLVGDLAGEERFLDSGRVVASNAKIFAAILKALDQKD